MFTGSAVAIVTPFDDSDRVDFHAFERLLQFHCDNGTDAILVCGTTGESATLTHAEHEEIITFAAKRLSGKRGQPGMPYLIAGTGSNNTAEAIRLTAHAAEAGADAALLITPYYNKPTQSGLLRHFEAIAAATPIPLIPYCVPSRTVLNINVETAVTLAQMPTVIGIKEASGNLEQISEIIRLAPESFSVWSGDDALTFPIMALGGKGVISVTANLVPRAIHEFATTCLAGDMARARAMHHRLFPLHKAMFLETNPIPVKTAMRLLHEAGIAGIPPVGHLRPPLYAPSEAVVARLRAALQEAEVLT